MAEERPSSHVETLVLSREQQWTLHHVLLDWLGCETATAAAGDERNCGSDVRRAFDELDTGRFEFTRAELEAVQDVLASYHHSATWWEVERARLEGLLYEVSTQLSGDGSQCEN